MDSHLPPTLPDRQRYLNVASVTEDQPPAAAAVNWAGRR